MHTAKQGETVPGVFIVIDEDSGQPFDLTGMTVTASANLQRGGGTATPLTAAVVSATGGRVSVVTAPLPVGVYNLEFAVAGAQGIRYVPSEGYLPVRIQARV